MTGPGVVEGSIVPNDMLPVLVPLIMHLGIIVRVNGTMLDLTLGVLLSATITENEKVPETFGVPERRAETGLSVRPEGRLPAVMDHEYGGVAPPVAVFVN